MWRWLAGILKKPAYSCARIRPACIPPSGLGLDYCTLFDRSDRGLFIMPGFFY
ncbi:hypothetical protein METHB2_960003 [Candidatus Methylobacter favarea]|uniref:Uncharacterized protein n=1 Tax=Candidatus Methylobacter favarea TaxID=2707345 RepID=A0A8S0WM36_9GAMM|nr:hypothetical protein METHB2_960003 [Candidatus Methylobacter favarea]